jgi:hypothetical protein
MRLKTFLCAGLFGLCGCSGAQPGHQLIPDDQVAPLVAKIQTDFDGRGKVYLSRADQMCDPQSAGYADLDKYLLITESLTASDGKKFQTRGHQLARYLIDWMQTLGTACRLTGDVKYRDFGTGMLIRCSESVTLNSPYMTGGFPGVRGDMMRALATGYDFFAAELTPEQRALVLNTTAEYMDDTIQSAQDLPVWWRPYHNFTGVCGGAAGWVALQQMAAGRPGADESLQQIIALVEDWLSQGFDEQGAYYEGTGYSAYPLENVILFADLLKRSGGKNLFEHPTLKRVINYYALSALPGEKLMDARNDSLYTSPGELLLKLASELQSGVAKWLYEPITSPKEKRTWSKGAGGSFFLELLWSNDVVPVPPADAGIPPAEGFKGRGLCIWRTGWDQTDVMFSIEAGNYYPVTHNQADKGHFTLYSHGRKWACDPGYANNKDPQGRAQTVAHNCVLIDGKGQALSGAGAGTSGRILAYTDTPSYGYALAGCTDAYRQSYTYNDETGGQDAHQHMPMDHAYRHTVFVWPEGDIPAYAVVIDDIQKDDSEHDYTWQMLSWPDLQFSINGCGAVVTPKKKTSSEKLLLWVDAEAPVAITEDFYTPGDSFKPASYPRLRATCRAVNPCFAAVLVPTDSDAMPAVRFEPTGGGNKTIYIKWSGKTDRITWNTGGADSLPGKVRFESLRSKQEP